MNMHMKKTAAISAAMTMAVATSALAEPVLDQGATPEQGYATEQQRLLHLGHIRQDGNDGVRFGFDWERGGNEPSYHAFFEERGHFDGHGAYSRIRFGMGFDVRPDPSMHWTLIELGLTSDNYSIEGARTSDRKAGYYFASAGERWWGEWGAGARLSYSNLVDDASGINFRAEGLYQVPRAGFLQLVAHYEYIGGYRETEDSVGVGLRFGW